MSVAGAMCVSAAIRTKPSSRNAFALLLCAFLVLSTASLPIRNRRVLACADTARKILSALPEEFRSPAAVQIGMSPAGGSRSVRTFGLYGLRGLETVGLQVTEDGVSEAVRYYFSNNELRLTVGPEGQLPEFCAQPRKEVRCFFVTADGQLIDAR